MSEQERSKEWVLERIRKLLTLGKDAGATDGERDNAMRMAHKLMAKYNLDAAEAEAHGSAAERRGFIKAQFYGRPWARTIAYAIAELYFCEYVIVPAKRATECTHYFFGKESNTQVASSISAWIVKSVQKEARDRQPTYEGNAWVRSFCTGVAVTIHRRVKAMLAEARKATQPEPGMSLVLANVYDSEKTKNAVIVKQRFEKLGSASTGKRSGSHEASAAGRKFGESVNLNRQVGGSTQKVLS